MSPGPAVPVPSPRPPTPEASSPAVTQMAEMWRYRGLIGNFASRELKSKYKHSVLGWTWSLINPAATLAVYTLVFSTIFRATPPKAHNGMTTYVIYLFIALVAWNFFSNVVNGSMAALIGAGPLLKKIYFPPYAPVIGNSFSALVQTFIEAGVLLVVLFGVGNPSWSMLFTPIILSLLLVFASGIGLMFALFNVYYRDVSYLVSIVMQLLFYSTPVIWAPSQLLVRKHGHFAIEVLSKSPMYQYVEGFRDALWTGTVPGWSRWVWMVASAIVSITVGLFVFNRGSRDVGEEL